MVIGDYPTNNGQPGREPWQRGPMNAPRFPHDPQSGSPPVPSREALAAMNKCKVLPELTNYIRETSFPYICDVTQYEKLAKIGQGTFGEVFKARCKRTNKIVALKKILIENEREGFPITALREVKMLQQLKHENITELIEVCSNKSASNPKEQWTFFLVFAFCDHDLAGLLNNHRVKFSPAHIKTLLKHLFNGLDKLHREKVMHRDMKTANILVSKEGVLKLADFGLSRCHLARGGSRKNCYTNQVVTLWYRPPELLLGERNYAYAIDIWGAGCIMAEMWARSPIFQHQKVQLLFDDKETTQSTLMALEDQNKGLSYPSTGEQNIHSDRSGGAAITSERVESIIVQPEFTDMKADGETSIKLEGVTEIPHLKFDDKNKIVLQAGESQPGMVEILHESFKRTDKLVELLAKQMENSEIAVNMLRGLSHPRSEMSQTRMRFPHLKDLPYPTFSGEKPHEFITFWNEFEACIGSRPDLRDSVKLQYLREALKRPAKGLVEGLQITDDKYEYVVYELKKQYGSWVSVEKAYFKRLEALASKPVQLKAGQLLKVFYEQRSLIRGLQEQPVIGIPHCQLIKKAYPWKFLERLVEKEAEFKERRERTWTVEELFSNIRTWINVIQDKEESYAAESSDDESVLINHVMSQPQTFLRNNFQRNDSSDYNSYMRRLNTFNSCQGFNTERGKNPRCYCCQQYGHRVLHCPQYRTLEEREKVLFASCKNCLSGTDHTSENCYQTGCRRCGEKHNFALCPEMYTNGFFDQSKLQSVFRNGSNRTFVR